LYLKEYIYDARSHERQKLSCIYINFKLRQIKESRHQIITLLMYVRLSRTSVLVQ